MDFIMNTEAHKVLLGGMFNPSMLKHTLMGITGIEAYEHEVVDEISRFHLENIRYDIRYVNKPVEEMRIYDVISNSSIKETKGDIVVLEVYISEEDLVTITTFYKKMHSAMSSFMQVLISIESKDEAYETLRWMALELSRIITLLQKAGIERTKPKQLYAQPIHSFDSDDDFIKFYNELESDKTEPKIVTVTVGDTMELTTFEDYQRFPTGGVKNAIRDLIGEKTEITRIISDPETYQFDFVPELLLFYSMSTAFEFINTFTNTLANLNVKHDGDFTIKIFER